MDESYEILQRLSQQTHLLLNVYINDYCIESHYNVTVGPIRL